MKKYIIALLICFSSSIWAQTGNKDMSDLPYYEIPETPESFSATNVVARMVDGLGVRYHWATKDLRPEDLSFKPSENGRTTEETIDHIHGLVQVVLNAILSEPNSRTDLSTMSFEEKRKSTLNMLKKSSELLRAADKGELSEYKVIFQRGEQTSEYPFWNILNGPLADALWHVGQVISHRRTSGNPFDSSISVFSGKVRK